MPQVVKTWSTWDNSVVGENLADAGTTASIAYDRDATDVAAKFTSTASSLTNITENARQATGDTWEDWGVPAGAVVIAAQITAWKKKVVTATNISANVMVITLIDSSNGNIVNFTGNAAIGTTTDGSYVAQAAGLLKAIPAANQPSTTVVKLNLANRITTGAGTVNVDNRFDDVEMTITYGMFFEDEGSGLIVPKPGLSVVTVVS